MSSSKTFEFTTEQKQHTAEVFAWVEAQKDAEKTVRIVFVNGILTDLTKTPKFCDDLARYFGCEVIWFKNDFLNTQFVERLQESMSKIELPQAVKDTAVITFGAALGFAVYDIFYNGGKTVAAVAKTTVSAILGSIPHVEDIARYVAKKNADHRWGPGSEDLAEVNNLLRDSENTATLFVGHSHGALSLATAMPHIQVPPGNTVAFLLLGSPDNQLPPPDVNKPVFYVIHEQDIVSHLHTVDENRVSKANGHRKPPRALDAHSLEIYSKQLLAKVDEDHRAPYYHVPAAAAVKKNGKRVRENLETDDESASRKLIQREGRK